MKKLFSATLALMLAAGCATSAVADQTIPLDDVPGTTSIPQATELKLDLDNDGSEETVSWSLSVDEDSYASAVELTAASADATDTFRVEFTIPTAVCYADLDGNGTPELLLSGDVMSSDYYTYCLTWKADHLVPYMFADIDRGELGKDAYGKSGYGALTNVAEDGTITLCGSQDMLGTWFAIRELKLKGFCFEINDDGLWKRVQTEMDIDPEYSMLTAKAEIPCTFIAEDGTETAGTITPGEKLLITATDKEFDTRFVTEDGRNGRFSTDQDFEQGFGSVINGIPESELFESIPYAD